MGRFRSGMTGLFGLVLAAGLIVCPGASTGSPAPRPLADGEVVRIGSPPSGPCRVEAGPLSLVAVPTTDGESFDAGLVYAGRTVDTRATGFVLLGAGRRLPDVPLPGCESRLVEMFSGGASCCFTYYLLGSCPSGPFALYIDSGSKSFMEDARGIGKNGTVKAFPVTDPVFQSYGPNRPGAKTWVSFSSAESPAVTRFVVFDNGSWRMDRVGEFPQEYDSLIAQVPDQHSVSPASAAVARAYYTAMKGEPAEPVLEAGLPGDWQPFKDVISTDIVRAVTGFNPIHAIDLKDSP